VLSRIAESLYWIGRYGERAEDTARLLDVHLQRMLADPWTEEDAACQSLLRVMGMPATDGPFSSSRVVTLLGLDDRNPSSVVGALAAARENARGGAGDRVLGDVGVPQLDLARPAERPSPRRTARGARVLPLGA
jgi:uncharacterized alpha-E superfamily protein